MGFGYYEIFNKRKYTFDLSFVNDVLLNLDGIIRFDLKRNLQMSNTTRH